MKIFWKLSFIVIFAFIFQGSGYVGERPNINEYFPKDQQETESGSGFIDIYKNPSILVAPPKTNAENLKKQLAPANYTNAQMKLLYPEKKTPYYDDLVALKPHITKLQNATKSPDLQSFACCVNVNKFYFNDFLNRYKNAPEAQKDLYKQLKDVNVYSQAILKQWNYSEDNMKFVSYSSNKGVCRPQVIKENLAVLDKKVSSLSKLFCEAGVE